MERGEILTPELSSNESVQTGKGDGNENYSNVQNITTIVLTPFTPFLFISAPLVEPLPECSGRATVLQHRASTAHSTPAAFSSPSSKGGGKRAAAIEPPRVQWEADLQVPGVQWETCGLPSLQ